MGQGDDLGWRLAGQGYQQTMSLDFVPNKLCGKVG